MTFDRIWRICQKQKTFNLSHPNVDEMEWWKAVQATIPLKEPDRRFSASSFFHKSETLAIITKLRISPQIFVKVRSGSNWILRGTEETELWYKTEVENLVSDSLYVFCTRLQTRVPRRRHLSSSVWATHRPDRHADRFQVRTAYSKEDLYMQSISLLVVLA